MICLLEKLNKNGEEKSNFGEEIARKKRAEFPMERINQYNDLARTAKEVGNHLGEGRWHRGIVG